MKGRPAPIGNPTAKSIAGKVFGTPNIKGALKMKAPKMSKIAPDRKMVKTPSKPVKSPTKASVEKSVRKTMGY